MKLRDYDGRVIRIIEAIPMIEHRFMFNGSMRRLLEPCKVGIKANAIAFDLANMKFEDLADDLKDEILGCRLSIFCLEDCSDEEVEEIFARLNNSTPLSPIQKCLKPIRVVGNSIMVLPNEDSLSEYRESD